MCAEVRESPAGRYFRAGVAPPTAVFAPCFHGQGTTFRSMGRLNKHPMLRVDLEKILDMVTNLKG